MTSNDHGKDERRALPPHARWLLRLAAIRRLRSLFLQNRDFAVRLPIGLRCRAWRHGFSYRDWLLYDLDHNDRNDYLPHHASLDHAVLYPGCRFLNDKLFLARGLAAVGIGHPRPLAFVMRGRLLPFAPGESAAAAGRWLAGQAALHGGVVLKPVVGLAGSGLLFIRDSAGGLTANGAPVSPAQLDQLLAGLDQYLVTDQIVQAAYSAAIFPPATNTLRILTVWDFPAGRPFVAAAVHRFGSARSLPVDNFHAGSGGLCAEIDLASGRLGDALTLDSAGALRRYPRHPETGAAIAGVAVPQWAGVLASARRAAAAFPEAPFVGWDIVLSEDGPVFLEANVPPGIHIWQVHGGLLRDPRVRSFFEAHGMLRPRTQAGRPDKRGANARRDPESSPRTAPRERARRKPEAMLPGGIPGNAYPGYPLPLRARLGLRLGGLRRLAAICAANRRDRVPARLPVRLRALRNGFCTRHWALFGLEGSSAESFVADFAGLHFGVRDANFRSPQDRLLLYRALQALGLLHPQVLAFVKFGRILEFDRPDGAPARPREWLEKQAERRGAILIEPVHGASGQGVFLLRFGDRRITVNGRDIEPSALEPLLAGLDQYLITDAVAPSPGAAAGTLSILTLWDYGANRPFVAAAALRLADSRSPAGGPFPRGRGGLLAGIEPGTGTLADAVTLDGRGIRRCFSVHPETGAAIAGVNIPLWPEVQAAVLRAAAALPGSPFIGWDIVSSDAGPCFVGGDAPPDLWPWQAHGGLLADPRARRFFAVHGLVRPEKAGGRGTS